MKDLKISTKLASAVLGKEVTKCSLINKSRNSINIAYFEDKEDFNPICREWNIYEFAFKCKEWALINGYLVMSGNCEAFKETNKYYDSHDNISILYTFASVRKIGTLRDKIELRGDSEAELIIKACNWILEQNNEKI